MWLLSTTTMTFKRIIHYLLKEEFWIEESLPKQDISENLHKKGTNNKYST